MDTAPATSTSRPVARTALFLGAFVLLIVLAAWLFFVNNPESWSAVTARSDARAFTYLEQTGERQFGGMPLAVGVWGFTRGSSDALTQEHASRAGMDAAIVQERGTSESAIVLTAPEQRTLVSDSSLKMGLTLSADGTRVAYVRVPQITLEDGSAGYAVSDGAWEVAVVNSASGEVEQTVPGTWAAFMGPEYADRLLYASEGKLMLLNLSTLERADTGLPATSRRDAFMLSESGRRLALKSDLTEGYTVYDLYRIEPAFAASPLLDIGLGYLDIELADDFFYGLRARPDGGTQLVRGALAEGEPLSVRMTFPEGVRIIGFGSRN